MGVALSWLGLILCIVLFFAFVEISWQGFLWTFKTNTQELLNMFSETEEMAA